MDKRLLSAMLLCALIMLGYPLLFRRAPPAATVENGGAASVTSTNTPAPADGATPTKPENAPLATPPAASSTAATVGPRIEETTPRELVVERAGANGEKRRPGHLRAVFTNVGGGIKELRSGRFFDHAGLSEAQQAEWKHWWPLLGNTADGATHTPTSFTMRTLENSKPLAPEGLDTRLWEMKLLGDADAPRGVEFRYAPGTGLTFIKRFEFVPGQDALKLEIEVHNDALADAHGARTFELTPVAWTHADSGDSYYPEPQAVAAGRENADAAITCNSVPRHFAAEEHGGANLGAPKPLAFVGVHSKYFAVLVTPREDSRNALAGANWRQVRDPDFVSQNPDKANEPFRQIVTDAQIELALPPVGGSTKLAFDVYAGPKEPDEMAKTSASLVALHDYDLGWVRWISGPLLFLLKLFHSLCSSWGLSIILLTLLVRLILFPINRRSQTAMARYQTKMKRVQPKIDEIKKRYEKDPTRLRQEQAKIMQQEGAFPPLGGCLPMFLQIPVFIGLYRALGISFDLRQAPFMGWIHDLALPDRVLTLDFNTHLPFVGTIHYLNILPLIMVVLWVWQQRLMPTPSDEQAARMQRMMMFMPIMMGVFLYNYAAGLSLYMITQSGLGIIETKIIKKLWPIDEKELATKKSGFWARMAAMQDEAARRKRNLQGGR